MDWDGVYSASELSSSETYSSDGREADDEQSDWVDPSDVHINDSHDPHASNGRQQRVPRFLFFLILLRIGLCFQIIAFSRLPQVL